MRRSDFSFQTFCLSFPDSSPSIAPAGLYAARASASNLDGLTPVIVLGLGSRGLGVRGTFITTGYVGSFVALNVGGAVVTGGSVGGSVVSGGNVGISVVVVTVIGGKVGVNVGGNVGGSVVASIVTGGNVNSIGNVGISVVTEIVAGGKVS